MSDEKTFTKDELETAIEEATGGLKAKVEELIGDNKKLKAEARKAKEYDPAEVERLHSDIEALEAKLAASEKAAKDSARAVESAQKALQSEQAVTHRLLVENGLRSELVANGITNAVHQKAAMAILAPQVTIEADGDNRIAKSGDKAIDAFVKDWAGGEEGKYFVTAAHNSGGGAGGGSPAPSGGKTLSRVAFNEMSPAEQMRFSVEGGKLEEAA